MYKSPKSSTKKYSRKANQQSKKTKKDIVCSQIQSNIASNEPLEDYSPAKGLFEEKDIEGKDVFQVTPSSRSNPKGSRKSLTEKFEAISLSNGVRNSKLSVKSEKKQSYSLRLKIKEEIAGMKSSSIESDPEDSDENESEEDWESESDEEILSSAVCDTSKRKYKVNTFADAYFTAQKQKKSATSNKTLSNLKLEQTSIQEVVEILQNVPESHKREKEKLFNKYCSQFAKWDCLLREGFNILLYGVGSKYFILKAFCEKFLQHNFHIVVHGFFPSLSIKEILCTITEDILEHDGKFSSIQDHCNYIKKYFTEREENLYIVIHSLDGVPLRSVKTQSFLSSLAAVRNIHFICSVDHINAPLLWDQNMLSHFQWIWYDTTTFEPYIYETSYDNSLLRDQSSHLMLSSLLHVYNSLTPNNRGVFLILAKHQKEEQKKSNNTGLTFHEWYQECREAFLVNSEITMQAQLSEFKNHKLLASRKNYDGVELWYIPVDDVTLQQFLENSE